jgi:ABC-type transport system involved in multi-copper enzyme maturation permease subunit
MSEFPQGTAHPLSRERLTASDWLVQTGAQFVAAYRELNARKLFWVALALNALVIGAVAAIGIDEKGISILGYELGIPGVNTKLFPDGKLYKVILSSLGVGFWLSWLSTILALLSTASMFPDLATGGVDTMLSKPIGRARLFLTKFATGLLFTALQVSVFAVLAFLVLGIRGGVWELGIFVVVPLMVVFFSYLFAVQAVVGMVTRSPIASVIVTLLFWIFIFLVHSGEQFTLIGRTASRLEIAGIEKKLESLQTEEAKTGLVPRLEEQRGNDANWALAHGLFYAAKSALPKTTETAGLVTRALAIAADIGSEEDAEAEDGNARAQRGFFRSQFVTERKLRGAIEEEMASRPVWWVVGTSFAFECVVLGLGIWYFRRRDF